MLHPSYMELMDIINKENSSKGLPGVTSRYSIIIAVSKRARQLIDGDEKMVSINLPKPLSIAVNEMKEGKITIIKHAKG